MLWVILSPHFDDAVYSLGAWLAQQVDQGQRVEVWTLCAGDPPPGPLPPLAETLHQLWGLSAEEALTTRRQEDRAACRRLGVTPVHWEVPDAIYRRDAHGEPLYADFAALTGPLHPSEGALVTQLAQALRRRLPPEARLVAPLAIGGHVDHRLTRAAAEAAGAVSAYYADFPYAARDAGRQALYDLPRQGWQVFSPAPQSPAYLRRWVEAILTYASQKAAFWASEQALAQEVEAFAQAGGGGLWTPPEPFAQNGREAHLP